MTVSAEMEKEGLLRGVDAWFDLHSLHGAVVAGQLVPVVLLSLGANVSRVGFEMQNLVHSWILAQTQDLAASWDLHHVLAIFLYQRGIESDLLGLLEGVDALSHVRLDVIAGLVEHVVLVEFLVLLANMVVQRVETQKFTLVVRVAAAECTVQLDASTILESNEDFAARDLTAIYSHSLDLRAEAFGHGELDLEDLLGRGGDGSGAGLAWGCGDSFVIVLRVIGIVAAARARRIGGARKLGDAANLWKDLAQKRCGSLVTASMSRASGLARGGQAIGD